jgi:sulfopyruvate decarboxylase subunit beta
LLGPDILTAIKASGIELVVSVPDIVTSEGLLRPLAHDPAIRHIRLCKEDEGVSICAALSYCNRRALLMMQQTGMYDSINAIRAIAVDYGHPVCMLIGLQGAEPDVEPRQSPKHIVRVAEPVLDALGVEHHLLRNAADVVKIRPAIDNAYASSRPVALLIGAMLPPA